jgi:glycine hydroxymethyltransferase
MSFAGYFMNNSIKDKDLFSSIDDEFRRQQSQIELIASENFVSKEVLTALGSIMTNKYAEGYPDKRYYGGCKFVDIAEKLAIARVCQLFGCKFANVQPHSGAQANLSVLYALAKPGDTILGMELAMGGHLTHGATPTISGKWFNAIGYGVNQDGLIDYDQVQEMAHRHKPKIIICGASSYSRKIDFKRFREIADSVGAYLLADIAHYAGLVVAGLYPSPVDHAHVVTSTTHKTLRGPRGGIILTNDESIAKKVDSAVFPGVQGGPQMHTIAAKAVAFGEALRPEFKEYARSVLENSITLAGRLHDLGMSIISGGTDSHMSVLDLTKLEITGKTAVEELEKVSITCNKNTIPFEKLSPVQTSGIRVGTAAMTTRGFGTNEFTKVAELIHRVLSHHRKSESESIKKEVRMETLNLCEKFPLYN